MRLYDADSGLIQIGGRKLSSIPLEELHQKFGVVFQNDVLFADTIYENIDFGRHLPPQEIEKAARCAQAWDFISSLPDGLNHRLTSKGTNLSGGQKQRVLVARALGRLSGNPDSGRLLSALDYKTDAALRKALREDYQGITNIIIASGSAHPSRGPHPGAGGGQGAGYGTIRSCCAPARCTRKSPTPRWGPGRQWRPSWPDRAGRRDPSPRAWPGQRANPVSALACQFSRFP